MQSVRKAVSLLLVVVLAASLLPPATALTESYTPYKTELQKNVSLLVNLTHIIDLYTQYGELSVEFTYQPPHDVLLHNLTLFDRYFMTEVPCTIYIDGELTWLPWLPVKLKGGKEYSIKLEPVGRSEPLRIVGVVMTLLYLWNGTAKYTFEVTSDGGVAASVHMQLDYEPVIGVKYTWQLTSSVLTYAAIDLGLPLAGVTVSGNPNTYGVEGTKVNVGNENGPSLSATITAEVYPGTLQHPAMAPVYGTHYVLRDVPVDKVLNGTISEVYPMLLKGAEFELIDLVSEPHEWKVVVAYNGSWTKEFSPSLIKFPEAGLARLFLILFMRVEGEEVAGLKPRYYVPRVARDLVTVGVFTVDYEVVDSMGRRVEELALRVDGFEPGAELRPGTYDLVVKSGGAALGRFKAKEKVSNYDGAHVYTGLGLEKELEVRYTEGRGRVVIRYTLHKATPAGAFVGDVYSLAPVYAEALSPCVVSVYASRPVIAKVERGVARVVDSSGNSVPFTESRGWLLVDVTAGDYYSIRLWATLTVRVVKEGEPVENARVDVLDSSYNVVASRYTGKDGEAAFTLEPENRYIIRVTSGKEVVTKVVQLMEDTEVTVAVTEAPPRVLVDINTVLLLVILAIVLVAIAVFYMVWRLRAGVIIE